MGTNTPHTCIPGLVWQKQACRFSQFEVKVGELRFPIHFVCVSAALYHRGVRGRHFPLRWIWPIAHVLISLALAPNDAQPKSPPPNGAPSQMRGSVFSIDPVKRHPFLHGHNQAAATETSNCCCVKDVQKRLSWQYYWTRFGVFISAKLLVHVTWPLMPVAQSWRLEVLYFCVPRVSMRMALISQKIFRFW